MFSREEPLISNHQVRGVPVEDVHVPLGDIDVGEEIVPHERVVALRMVLGQTHVLIHVERDDVLERQSACLVQRGQRPVHAEGRGTRRQAQNKRLIQGRREIQDLACDVAGGPLGSFFIVRLDDDSHRLPLSFHEVPRTPASRSGSP